MNRKIAITKNGYDIMRIIEGHSDRYNCDFKFKFMVDNCNLEIYYLQLFSEAKLFEFDTNKELEITYHKSTLSRPTKIHLRLKDIKTEEIRYETLPLEHLINPDMNTEIPIPLIKIKVTDSILNQKYTKKKNHCEFDIKDNNMIEIYLTKNGWNKECYMEKWQQLNILLTGNSMEYFATGSTAYIGKNIQYTFSNRDEPRKVRVSADITDDIGIQINTIKIPNLEINKLAVLFIENEAFLGLLSGTPVRYPDEQWYERAYLKDFENEKYFTSKEKEKWTYNFNKEIKRTDKLIKKYKDRYELQEQKYMERINEITKLKEKANNFINVLTKLRYSVFKKYDLLINDDKDLINEINFCNDKNVDFIKILSMNIQDIIEQWLISSPLDNSIDVNVLFAKYLGLDEMKVFVSTLVGQNYNQESIIKTKKDCKFNNVILIYENKYSIELLRGMLNFFDKTKKEPNVLIDSAKTYNVYKKHGYPKFLVEKCGFKVEHMDMYEMNKDNFEMELKQNDNLLEKIYEMICKEINNNNII